VACRVGYGVPAYDLYIHSSAVQRQVDLHEKNEFDADESVCEIGHINLINFSNSVVFEEMCCSSRLVSVGSVRSCQASY